jgi:hypothetical protein
VLPDKVAGGDRPIALLAMLCRVRGRLRKHLVGDWELQRRGWWDAAVVGNSVIDATYIAEAGAELFILAGEEVAAILADLAKFYEQIGRGSLLAALQSEHFPLPLAVLAIEMHSAPRRIE